MKVKLLVACLAGISASLLLAAGLFLVSRPDVQSEAGGSVQEESKTLPNFFMPDLEGEVHSISGLRGKPAVVNFWATWCRPCEEEMPLLQSYSEKYPQVEFVGVNSGEDGVLVQRFVDKYDITFSIWLDSDEDATNQMNIIGLPTTYFIDSQGVIQATHLGQLSPALLDQYLSRLGIEP